MSEQQKLDPLEGLPPDKLEATLQRLEMEKERRREEQIANGKLIVLTPVTRIVSRGYSEPPEVLEATKAEAIARHLAQHPEDRGKTFEVKLLTIITGVERGVERGD